MSSIVLLKDALLQLEDHLCRAGSALVRAEQDTPPADVLRMLRAFGWRYKAQVEFLRDYGEAVQELGSDAQLDRLVGLSQAKRVGKP